MELFKEILIRLIEHEEINIIFPSQTVDVAKIIEAKCYQTLHAIKTIIEDDSLADKECFVQIEKIVCLLEDVGSNGGSRHDFG